jgi:glycosyltransferase involved in cell wall biosynthesis
MKVVHFSTSESLGGAAQATYKLHKGLLDSGIDSRMYVKYISSPRTREVYELQKQRGILENKILPRIRSYQKKSLLNSYSLKNHAPFSWNKFLPNYPLEEKAIQEADIVGLYWIGEFISPENLSKIRQPIVWRLSDIWPFSGGCHYPGNCLGFQQSCGNCPVLQSHSKSDESQLLLARKIKSFENLNITIAAPSNWIARLAGSSSLFKDRRIEVIKTGVDENHFKPLNKTEMRKAFSIPENSELILFGADSASDPRKGIRHLINALKIIQKSSNRKLELGIFGRNYDPEFDTLGFPVRYFGYITELYLPVLYNCADLFISPSLEENLPNTALEAMACQIPVCGFDIGGMSDLIQHKKDGMLAESVSPESLAENILYALDNSTQLGQNARNSICEKFTQKNQTQAYISLYNSLC